MTSVAGVDFVTIIAERAVHVLSTRITDYDGDVYQKGDKINDAWVPGTRASHNTNNGDRRRLTATSVRSAPLTNSWTVKEWTVGVGAIDARSKFEPGDFTGQSVLTYPKRSLGWTEDTPPRDTVRQFYPASPSHHPSYTLYQPCTHCTITTHNTHVPCTYSQSSFVEKQARWTEQWFQEAGLPSERVFWFEGGVTPQHIENLFVTLILNGLHPYPSLRRYWNLDGFAFNDPTVKRLWGNSASGYRQVELLKKYIRFRPPDDDEDSDVYDSDSESDDEDFGPDVFSKVRPMADMLRRACETTFEVGRDCSLDEIDINTQCKFRGKDKIKYKKEGDGVLNDAICTSVEGALITFCFRKDSLQRLRKSNPAIYASAKELSPLHLRCLGLLNRPCIKGKWRTIWMDNLFPSLRFFYYGHTLTKTHMCGLFRANRGFSACA